MKECLVDLRTYRIKPGKMPQELDPPPSGFRVESATTSACATRPFRIAQIVPDRLSEAAP